MFYPITRRPTSSFRRPITGLMVFGVAGLCIQVHQRQASAQIRVPSQPRPAPSAVPPPPFNELPSTRAPSERLPAPRIGPDVDIPRNFEPVVPAEAQAGDMTLEVATNTA